MEDPSNSSEFRVGCKSISRVIVSMKCKSTFEMKVCDIFK